MDRFGLLLFIGIGSILVLVFIVSQWLEKRRTDAWRRAAEALGLPFLGANNDILNRTAGFKVLSEGIRQRFYNAVEADADNVRITVGDFSYRTRTSNGTRGSKSKRHVRTLCVLETNTLDTPHCHLRPQRAVFDKLGALLGGQDINFDDDPAFSDAYVLQGEQESSVRELFDAQTRAWFADHSSERFRFETQDSRIVFYYRSRRAPEDFQLLMQQALEVSKLLSHA